MGKLVRKMLRGLGVIAALVLGLTFMFASTAAADCGTIPASERIVHHKEISHIEMKTVPGTAEEGYDAQRWSRPVEAVTELSHLEAQFSRFVAGKKEKSHQEWRFYHINPGQEEISWQVYRFFRENPGQKEETRQLYRFKKWVEGQDESCTYLQRYERVIDVFKTKYQYKKQVRGDIEQKDAYGKWTKVDTFGWEDYWGGSTQWSFEDKDVLDSGPHNDTKDIGDGKRKHSTNFQYVKSGKTDKVKTGTTTEQSGWLSESPGKDWYKIGEPKKDKCTPAVKGHYVYKTNGDPTTDPDKADWFPDSSYDGWKQFGDSKTDITQAYVAPFTEYKTKDGVTTDPDKADWFKDSSFKDWKQFGDADTHIEQEAIEPFTEYRDKDGEPTTDEDKAAWFDKSSFAGWNQYREPKTEIDQAGTPDVTYYLTINGEGKFGETTVKSDASWINLDKSSVDTSVWTQIGAAVKKIDRKAEDAYTEYYVPGGTPTRELGESNWTTDAPKGWTFVDEMFIVTKKAVPGTAVPVKVVDKKASVETIKTPAKKLSCNPVKRTGQQVTHSTKVALADTGASGGIVAALLLGIGALAAGGVAVKRGLRNRS